MPDIFVSPKTDTSIEKTQKRKISPFSSAFSSYLFSPANIRFETQIQGENIVLLLRKHWITNMTWLTTSILLIVMPIFLFPLLSIYGMIPSGVPSSFITLIIFIWYLLTSTYILINFLLWYFTVSIVTDQRIIDIDYVNILNKKFAATTIGKVEDVTLRERGFVNTIFDYGDVIVQTAATEGQFHFLGIPHPEKVVRIINELMGKSEDEHG